jgi:hypothetical protein
MKIIKTIFSLLLTGSLLLSACNNSGKEEAKVNTDKEEIKKTLDTYNAHFMKGEFAAMTDYIYPLMFGDFTKEQMIAGQEQSLHSELFDVSINSITIDSISDVYMHNADKYALATHKARNTFQFKNEATEEILNAYCMNFKNSLGEANVKCNIPGKNFDVTMQDISFLIYSDKDKKWFTLGTTNPEDVNKFIPEEIRKKLNIEN